ncbi:TIGR02757 family protein [Pedobacter yonginense]|uniref:TIGR02757 family protein n=1 Tax=Pedobacter yonginense TaxID=651869 RepID=A0A317ET36_9SPHI|nr:TIGR02757 family protein [Pedobacter yonginense]PWS29237.1 TIGR02757 family protein [Pedobacter yonginense]
MDFLELRNFLDQKVEQYNQPNFIANDPVCIPHLFERKQDIEISGFFAAILAWGQRKTIINKCKALLERMDFAPYDFVLNHGDGDLKSLLGFKHRTFNDTDLLYFIAFFKQHYSQFNSLEDAFIPHYNIYPSAYLELDRLEPIVEASLDDSSNGALNFTIEAALNHFRTYFFSLEDFPHRTKKHISSPRQKSTCKRLNMFLRWMVRKDKMGVDFGIWNTIKPEDLICPCDVHVDRVGRLLGLIQRKQTDWQTAVELTQHLKEFDAQDPVKYDFALFGLGVEKIL